MNKKNIDKIFYGIMFLSGILAIELIILCGKKFSGKSIGVAENTFYLISTIIYILGILIASILQIVYLFKEASLHVARYHGVQCFKKIDYFYSNLGECNGLYHSIIREINKVYNKDSEVKQLVEEGDLHSLYARKSYLENKLDFHSNIMQIFTAIGVSAVVAFTNWGIENGTIPTIICIVVALVVMCCAAWQSILKKVEEVHICIIYMNMS